MHVDHTVLVEIRTILERADLTLLGSTIEARLTQLAIDMVDGRVVARAEATALRAAILDVTRASVLPRLSEAAPNQALRLLDRLAALGIRDLDGERVAIEGARRAAFPIPEPAAWPELDELRAAAVSRPAVCKIAAPVEDVAFVRDLAAEGVELPEEVLALYAACDGFDLSCEQAEYLPVFSLLPSAAIDTSGDAPRRAVVFEGGDNVHLSIHRADDGRWRVVYEHQYEAVAEADLDVRAILRFGLARMRAPVVDDLFEALSWDAFFGVLEG